MSLYGLYREHKTKRATFSTVHRQTTLVNFFSLGDGSRTKGITQLDGRQSEPGKEVFFSLFFMKSATVPPKA